MAHENRVLYYVMCVSAFANRHNMSQKDAFVYLYDYHGIEFLIDCYEAEHTLSLDNAVEDLTLLCKNNGGQIGHHNFADSASPECNTDNKYNIVLGPVANDDITALINVYQAGILSNDALIKELTYRELSEQISFHTERAIANLRKTGARYD